MLVGVRVMSDGILVTCIAHRYAYSARDGARSDGLYLAALKRAIRDGGMA